MGKEYFKVFHSYLKSIEPLGDAERGRLFTAMLEYSITGIAQELSGNERFIFPTIQANMDRETELYKNTVERNRINGKYGGRPQNPKNPVGFLKSEKSQDKDKDKDKDKENSISCEIEQKKSRRFSPPSLADIEAYCLERNSNVDAKAFYDYFSAGGWIDAKGQPVKSWKQKLITWEKFEPKVTAKPEQKRKSWAELGAELDAQREMERAYDSV